jgi:hypothetical protein
VTLTRRFGDCKDKVTLFLALARANGVAAHAVLVGTGRYHAERLILPTSSYFDHMIVCVDEPSAELCIDLTELHAPTGELPLELQGAVRWSNRESSSAFSTPESLCTEKRTEHGVALRPIARRFDEFRRALDDRPVVIHGIELSIGSACGWNDAYVRLLDALREEISFEWHSEHLAYHLAAGADGETRNAGVPLPLPSTREAADLVSPRAAALMARYGVPFLLENTVHYLPDLPGDPGWGEWDLLRAVAETSGCGLLLDLFNLRCHAINLGVDPLEALARLPLDRVVEIHVAGGRTHDGFLLDSHSSEVPEPVWQLLIETLPRTPNAAAVVFELLDEAVDGLGQNRVAAQVERAPDIWRALVGGEA